MKSADAKRTPTGKDETKGSRGSEAIRRVDKEPRRAPAEPPAAARADAKAASTMPDLTAFGVSQRDADAHVGQCEPCGRAYKHVVKNPKDTMALQSFGRNIACCLAGKQPHA